MKCYSEERVKAHGSAHVKGTPHTSMMWSAGSMGSTQHYRPPTPESFDRYAVAAVTCSRRRARLAKALARIGGVS